MTTTRPPHRHQSNVVLSALAPLAELVAIPPGSGLDTDDLARVLLAIRSFMAKAKEQAWHTPDGAEGWCQDASDEFLHELEDVHGFLGADIEHYDFGVGWTKDITREMVLRDTQRFPYAYGVSIDTEWHWAVRCGHLIIDWTARQFDARAPCPALWIDTSDGQGSTPDSLARVEKLRKGIFARTALGPERLAEVNKQLLCQKPEGSK